MKFKKGDRVQTEDGDAGEILFIDNRGLEAQVALQRITVKIRTDALKMFKGDAPVKVAAKPATPKKRAVRSQAKK